jgi:hypothetical protein
MKVNFKLLLIFFLLTVSFSHAQDSSRTEQERIDKANEILKLAREAVYQRTKMAEVKSLSLKDAGTNVFESTTKVEGRTQPQVVKFQRGIEESIAIRLFDKINLTTFNFNPDISPAENYTKVEDILSGNQVSRQTDTIANGKAVETDKIPNVPNMPASVKKQLIERLEKRTTTTKEEILRTASNRLFPLLLDTTWMNGKPLMYIGRADAGDTRADILEVKTDTGRRTRYFFDEHTHLLLMMTDEVSRGDLSSKVSAHYSDYQLVDGLMIAKKINTEMETTDEKEIEVKGKTLKASNKSKTIREMNVREFKVNPKSKPELFAVKEGNAN